MAAAEREIVPMARRTAVAWQYQSFDRVPRMNAARALNRFKLPVGLRLRLGEFAEVFVATSGLLAVVTIVVVMAVTVRGIQSLRRL
jgi:hypothetical protein